MTLADSLRSWAESLRAGPQPRGAPAAPGNGYTYEVRVGDELIATHDNPERAMTQAERLRNGGRPAFVRNVEPQT